MLPYKTMILLDRKQRSPLYLQICNALIQHISGGMIQPGHKLPGTRTLSELLEVNRRTIISAYEELEAQGWVETRSNQGCFVSSKLPLIQHQSLSIGIQQSHRQVSLFDLNDRLDYLSYYTPPVHGEIRRTIDAGYPDVRLAPLDSLTRNFNGLLKSKRGKRLWNYSDSFCGDLVLRKEVAKYLVETRSIDVSPDHIMITRGSLMAFFNIFQVLLSPGEHVVVGRPGFQVANQIIRLAQGKLVEIPVDEAGIQTQELERLCRQMSIRAVFTMPHHHNPTTVSLSAERRMHLLQLANQYQFAIIEDDYDYDFHYASSPILPMASSDSAGVVIYVGSLSKTIAPGLRMGFIVAPINLIQDFSRLSRFMDCHGNMALERAIALLFKEGEIRRHMKKALRVYRERRDRFCELLDNELGDVLNFQVPEGGMAAWVNFDASFPISTLREQALKEGLLMPRSVFADHSGHHLNAIRMGFASLNFQEMEEAIHLLKTGVREMIKGGFS